MTLPSKRFLSNMKMFLVVMVGNFTKKFHLKTEGFGLLLPIKLLVYLFTDQQYENSDLTLIVR